MSPLSTLRVGKLKTPASGTQQYENLRITICSLTWPVQSLQWTDLSVYRYLTRYTKIGWKLALVQRTSARPTEQTHTEGRIGICVHDRTKLPRNLPTYLRPASQDLTPGCKQPSSDNEESTFFLTWTHCLWRPLIRWGQLFTSQGILKTLPRLQKACSRPAKPP